MAMWFENFMFPPPGHPNVIRVGNHRGCDRQKHNLGVSVAPCRVKSHWKMSQREVSRLSRTTVAVRSPTPVDMENPPLFTDIFTSQVVGRISEPSTVGEQFTKKNEKLIMTQVVCNVDCFPILCFFLGGYKPWNKNHKNPLTWTSIFCQKGVRNNNRPH